jgi:hypothetical protein
MKRCLLLVAAAGALVAWMASPFEEKVLAKFTAHVYGLPHEKLYVHTDKGVYTVGEKVWFRAYLVDARNHRPRVLSRFVYVDLVDRRDSLVTRVKIVERGDTACFHGFLAIPASLPQGDYCLRGYSYYMQNEGDDFLFKKRLRVINPRDSRVETEVSYGEARGGRYTMSARFTDGVGVPFDKAFVTHETDQSKGDFGKKTTRANEEGWVNVRVDTAVRYVRFGFLDGDPFPFTRYVHVPRLNGDVDVQFFPEGGTLLSGIWQNVAFKAVGADGMPVEITGELFQDSVMIAALASRHDGMGVFRMPVSPGHRFSVVARLPSGEERRYDLPDASRTGVGVAVEVSDSVITYQVMKGEEARLPEDLYVFVHSGGRVLGIEPVDRLFRGQMFLESFPEGIAHVSLVDGQGRVYSERLFFARGARPQVSLATDRTVYATRDRVMLDVSAEAMTGSFSVAVTDDSQVPVDSLEDNILSNLLLTSELKGYIHAPAYYFSDHPSASRDLDLVMMTHGWRRFDLSRILNEERGAKPYPIERGQVVSGKVDNFWGKSSKMANVILLSTSGIIRTGETDDAGRFLIDVAFPDSTQFVLQAVSDRGRRSVSVSVDDDPFLPPRYTFPRTLEAKRDEERFFRKYGQNFYYENGEKVYILDEVIVVSRRQPTYHSFYDRQARYYVDSAAIAEMRGFGVPEMIQQLLPGVLLERDEDGTEYFSHFGRRLYVQANDFEETMDFLRSLHPEALLGMSMLDAQQSFMFFGERGAGGALIISYKFGFVPRSPGRPNIVPFMPPGYQKLAQFYVPKYEVDSVRQETRHDARRTIYWNPVVSLTPENDREQLSFYTADTPGSYSIILEGITAEGRLCRTRQRLIVK